MTTGCTPDCRPPSDTNAHCPTCHRTFGAITGFDAHRQAPGGPKRGAQPVPASGPVNVCVEPAMLGYVERGGVWRKVMSTEDREKRGFA